MSPNSTSSNIPRQVLKQAQMHALAKFLKAEKGRRRMNQAEFARYLDLQKDQISRYIGEKGFPRDDVLNKIAQKLNVTLNTMVPGYVRDEPDLALARDFSNCPMFQMTPTGVAGEYLVHVYKALPASVALEIGRLVNKDYAATD